MLPMPDYFSAWRWLRRLRGGTWVRWQVLMPEWCIDYRYWRREEPPTTVKSPFYVLAVERWS